MKAEYNGVTFEGTPEEIAAVLKAAGIAEEVKRLQIQIEPMPMPTWKPYEIIIGSGAMDYGGGSVRWSVLNADASPPAVPNFSGMYSI